MQENFSENYPTLTAFGMNKESALELIGMLYFKSFLATIAHSIR